MTAAVATISAIVGQSYATTVGMDTLAPPPRIVANATQDAALLSVPALTEIL